MPDPIQITFYNPDDTVKAEYSKLRIPLGLVDIALDLSENQEPKSDRETWAAIKAFIVEVFGNQFTLEELNQGADLGDMMSVFNMIVAKISSVSREFQSKPYQAGDPASDPQALSKVTLTDLKISLVETFHWSIFEIDSADYESTLKFMRRFAETHGPKEEQMLARKQVYCDQVSWL